MAKKGSGVRRPAARPSPARPSGVPALPADLANLVNMKTWPKGQVFHRIHQKIYGSSQFNPGKGNARFSPIKASDGSSIPTLYGGTTFECAAMETVFHDVPFAPGLKTFDKQKLVDQVRSQVTPKRDLNLVELSTTSLRKLGVKRSELIDTEKDEYPNTRKWAEAIHAACPHADGLCWVSRQDDRALALMLFGDRITAKDLSPTGAPQNLLTDIPLYADLVALADRIGVNLVDGK
ncbi:RES family NAD+ phosphorylase [Bradyrhizobium australiense]|uniref:RES family NAD+ phosphorylase n=1 Tax=Bradyrhizobium australiense TaxID=2721161 RepID=A0A7Y4GTK9_9BRAD|nr:RES family NAD+ phosphorylase [Bradyrhizobium australiense]NOJ41512.1 RES family NAD+ phosphorylase [Bradyrhizobium australiense]